MLRTRLSRPDHACGDRAASDRRTPRPSMRGVHTLSMAKAINAGLREALLGDEKVLLMGEDIGPLGGVFRVTEGLSGRVRREARARHPARRVGASSARAIGLAMRGYRPVVEIQFDGFIFPGVRPDHHAARPADRAPRRHPVDADRHPGAVRRPHRLDRAPPGEPRGVLRAHAGPARGQPVEPARRVLDDPGGDRLERPGAVLRAEEPLLAEGRRRPRPLGPAAAREPRRAAGHRCHARRPRRDGRHAAAGRRHRRRGGHEPRGRRPALALPHRLRAAARLGAEAPGGSSWPRRPRATSAIGSEIAATVAERAFYSLEAPVLRVSGFDTPFPPAALETEFLPSPDRVLEAVDRALAY